MKTPILRRLVLLLAIVGLANPVLAEPSPVVRTRQNVSCQHVMQLLMQYGNNNGRQNANQLVLGFGNSLLLGSDIGDLEIVTVTLVEEGCATAGPTVAVALRNNSHRDVCHFSVSTVAVFGSIHAFSPTTTAQIQKVCAGETLEVQLQLPLESLAMGQAGSQTLAFQKLVVAIDSFDELAESNEANNLLVINRAEIPLAVVEADVAQPAQPAAPPVGTLEATPNLVPNDSTPETQPNVAVPNTVDPATPRSQVSPDDIDFDNLELINR